MRVTGSYKNVVSSRSISWDSANSSIKPWKNYEIKNVKDTLEGYILMQIIAKYAFCLDKMPRNVSVKGTASSISFSTSQPVEISKNFMKIELLLLNAGSAGNWNNLDCEKGNIKCVSFFRAYKNNLISDLFFALQGSFASVHSRWRVKLGRVYFLNITIKISLLCPVNGKAWNSFISTECHTGI